MHNETIIKYKDVYKTYNLYNNPVQMAFDLLGLYKFIPWKKLNCSKKNALENISLEIKRGERVGLIGRNGAGKSTLLKLMTNNFKPSSGEVVINGSVQPLMDSGMGFHPEFTGRENIKAVLPYNGLTKKEMEYAIDDILDFVELGDYIDQPIRTYSLGMLSRLGFATATAIKPDILIVDEVLGAGDAYFAAKSSDRMKKLTKKGVTLLLVSHSTAQVLQFCERCVWVDAGKVREDGKALDVVKSYDKYIQSLDNNRIETSNQNALSRQQNDKLNKWVGLGGLSIQDVKLFSSLRENKNVFSDGERIIVSIEFLSEVTDLIPLIPIITLFTLDGVFLSSVKGLKTDIKVSTGQKYSIEAELDVASFGARDYILSISLHKYFDINTPSSKQVYDLVDRCIQFKIVSEDIQEQSLIRINSSWSTIRS